MRLTDIKGVGDKTSALFNKLNIYTPEDLLAYYPRNYDIYEEPICVKDIDNKLVVSIEGVVMRTLDVKHFKNISIASTVIKDKSGDTIKVTWFNMPYLRNTVKYGEKYVFRGRIKYSGITPTLEQPQIFPLGKYAEKLNYMQPIYSLTKGINNNTFVKAISNALIICSCDDYLPEDIREQYNLVDYKKAIKNIHFPEDMESLKNARRRLIFDEFFSFIMNMEKLKEKESVVINQYVVDDFETSKSVIKNLPYELTNAQMRCLKDIRQDISGSFVMQRLLQGDVGSGKTIIAFLTALDFARSSLQSVIMAPTEVLCEQHYKKLVDLINDNSLQYKVCLLTGSLSIKKKREAYEKIENGEYQIIIGTHAVFQEGVVYNNLSLVVIDEQHRFGVLQRGKLMNKGMKPHTLVMSATPIPRTLAIILYGDMDISVIDELPQNRKSIKNCVVTKDYRPKVYKFIANQVNDGRQVYVICPMIEENDTLQAENVVDYTDILKENLPANIKIQYLHGKMSSEEKNEILRKFETNEINVLVSTTVIEVGIDVPNATVMVVENSERFGLSSLHQLRGRVGRGNHQSYAVFVSATKDKDKLEKLGILNKSNDGFYIASEDLRLRGPGDFFGIRQSGEMGFNLADVYTDGDILKDAKSAVEEYNSRGLEFIDKKINDDIVIY